MPSPGAQAQRFQGLTVHRITHPLRAHRPRMGFFMPGSVPCSRGPAAASLSLPPSRTCPTISVSHLFQQLRDLLLAVRRRVERERLDTVVAPREVAAAAAPAWRSVARRPRPRRAPGIGARSRMIRTAPVKNSPTLPVRDRVPSGKTAGRFLPARDRQTSAAPAGPAPKSPRARNQGAACPTAGLSRRRGSRGPAPSWPRSAARAGESTTVSAGMSARVWWLETIRNTRRQRPAVALELGPQPAEQPRQEEQLPCRWRAGRRMTCCHDGRRARSARASSRATSPRMNTRSTQRMKRTAAHLYLLSARGDLARRGPG